DISRENLNIGDTDITYTVIGNQNDTVSCTFRVSVLDDSVPMITCPSDTIVTVPGTGIGAFLSGLELVSAVDNCSSFANLTQSYTLSGAVEDTRAGNLSQRLFTLGTTTVTYMVLDAAGNQATCSFEVVVRNPAVGVECPTGRIVGTAAATCDTTLQNLAATILPHPDSAMHVLYSTTGVTTLNSPTTGINDISGETFNVGITDITYTVIGNQNDTVSCAFRVSVLDDSIPMISCPSDTIVTVPFGTNSMIVDGLALESAIDNCTTPAALSDSYELSGATSGMGTGNASGVSFNLGTTTVIYTVGDEAGNEAVCTFNVTVRNPAVGVECPTDTTVIATMESCDTVLMDLSAMVLPHPDSAMHVLYTATGDTELSSPSTGINDISGERFNAGITQVEYTVIGNQNDTVTCTFLVTVQDTFPPTFECPSDVTVTADGVTNTAQVNGIGLQNLMDCDPTTQILYTVTGATSSAGMDDASGTIFNVDTSTVRYVVSDMLGNIDSCSFLVIVEEAPLQLTCPADVTQATATDTTCTAVVNGIAAMIADMGILESLTYVGTGATTFASDTTGINDASGTIFNVGTTMVTYIAADTLGNSIDCSFEVTIQGAQDLFITCPADLTLFVAPGDTTAVAGDLSPMAFGYPCTQNDSFAITYAIEGVITPGDASGLTFDEGATTVRYAIQDTISNFDNCDFTVRVRQQSPVSLICPNNQDVGTDAGLCDATLDSLGVNIDAGLIDTMTLMLTGVLSDTIVADSLLDVSGTTFPVGTTTVAYVVVDTLGYTTFCTFDVVVSDDEEPTLECPNDLVLIATEGDTALVVNNNIALLDFKDNCDANELSVTYTLTGATMASDTANATGQTFNLGETDVIYTITDAGGNSNSCRFEVEIGAADDLVIDCPADVVVSASPFVCSAQVPNLGVTILSPDSLVQSITYGVRGATIMDSPVTGFNDASIETYNVGINTVIYTVIDTLGRPASCSFMVTVEDNTPPRFNCPSDLTVNIPFEDSTAVVNGIDLLNIQDNCDPNPMVTYELSGATTGMGTGTASGQTFNLGNTDVTYTVTDNQGLSFPCTFTVNVDQLGLMFENCPTQDFVLQTDTMQCGTQLDTIGVSVSPLSSVASLMYTLSESGTTTFQSPADSIRFADGTFFNVGTTTVTYIATDILGSQETCSFDVIVEDDIDPIFVNCPSNMLVDMDVQECFATVSWVVPDVIEGCDFTMLPNHTPGSVIEITRPAGDTTITYVATDVNGNTASCTFEITVVDQQLPNYIFCPETAEDYTVIQSDTICGAIVEWNEPQHFDNCGVVDTMQTHRPGEVFNYGTTTVTYTAFDAAGNEGRCTFDVEVIDALPITLMDCPMDTMIVIREDSTVVVDWTEPTVGGTCGNDFTLESNFNSGDTFPEGMTTVTYVATDTIAMNSDTCSFVITVQIDTTEIDTLAPVFVNCPMNMILGTDEDECFATVAWTEPTATDNVGVDS
ncbi:MAG: HYR domain-containing protein, partial [Bacteroidota bacterium]